MDCDCTRKPDQLAMSLALHDILPTAPLLDIELYAVW